MAHRRPTASARSDRAVTTAEYALVLGGVALLAAAAFVGLPGAIRQLYDRALCALGGACPRPAGHVHPAIDPWDSPDPVTRATWGRMVVLGDSYSSGEGGERYGFSGSTPECHASARGYGPRVAAALGMTGRITVAACTGATLSALDRRYDDHDQQPQIRSVDADTSLVTMSLGGNDLDWAELLAECVGRTAIGNPLQPSCQSLEDASVEQRIRDLQPRLERADAEIRQRAPHARVIVLGYPRFFPARPTTSLAKFGTTVIRLPDEAWMNDKTAELDSAIARAARKAGVEYVDTTAALAGHELTTADPWIWGLDLSVQLGWPPVRVEQHDLHPTPDGQAAMARLTERQIRLG